MANSLTTQVIIDGPRHAVVKVIGVLDTSDQALVTIVDPATLTGMDVTGGIKAAKVRLKHMEYAIEDGLTVNLYWDATTAVIIGSFNGRGKLDARHYDGLPNNAGAGVTGKILLATQGFAVGAVMSFSLDLELIKQGR